MNNNLQKWRKPYLIILVCVTAYLCILGIGFHAAKSVFDFGWFTSKDSKTLTSEDISYEGEDITGINLNADLSNVEIKTDSYTHVSYECPEEYAPDVNIDDNGVLNITADANRKINPKKDSTDYSITIYIQEGTDLEKVDIQVDLGAVKISDITCKELIIDADLGDVNLKKITTKTTSIDADLGNVESKDCNHGKVYCTLDMGNCELDGDFDYVEVDNSMGNIEITTKEELTSDKLDLEVDLGTIKINGVEQKSL